MYNNKPPTFFNKMDGVPDNYERKELRIIKQAIAKSFIASGKIDLDFNQETEVKIEKWIHWIYRDEEKDWQLIKERKVPF